MNGQIRAASDVQSDIRLSSQIDRGCHGRQSECLSEEGRLPNTDKPMLVFNSIEESSPLPPNTFINILGGASIFTL